MSISSTKSTKFNNDQFIDEFIKFCQQINSELNITKENMNTVKERMEFIINRNEQYLIIQVLIDFATYWKKAKNNKLDLSDPSMEMIMITINYLKTNVNQKNDEGYTLFYVSCMNGNTDLCELLIHCGANTNYEINYISTWGIACINCNLDICQLLIDYGIKRDSYYRNYAGNINALCRNIKKDNKMEVCNIIKQFLNDILVYLDDYQLNSAAEKGCMELCKAFSFIITVLLTKVNVKIIHQPLWRGQVKNGHIEICELLIRFGAYLDRYDSFVRWGMKSPFQWAREKGYIEICKLFFLCGLNIVRNNKLLKNESLTSAELWISDEDCYDGKEEGWDKDMVDGKKSKMTDKEIYDMLLANWFGNFFTVDCKWTPLHVACSLGKIKVCQMLINKRTINWSINGVTPLTIAIHRGYCDICNLLISNGANVNHKDEDGNSLLWIACCINKFEVVKSIENGADVNLANDNGETPFMFLSEIEVTIM